MTAPPTATDEVRLLSSAFVTAMPMRERLKLTEPAAGGGFGGVLSVLNVPWGARIVTLLPLP